MEISWLGLFFLLVAWACAGASTGCAFYLHTKQKDYDMNSVDNTYLLTAAGTAAGAVAFMTIVVLMVIFMGRNQFTGHARTINKLMSEKLELENKLNDASFGGAAHGDTAFGGGGDDFGDDMGRSSRRNILENPIPIRRGRSARPLIV